MDKIYCADSKVDQLNAQYIGKLTEVVSRCKLRNRKLFWTAHKKNYFIPSQHQGIGSP